MGILDRNKSPAVLSKSSMQSVSIPNGTKQQFASSAHSKAIGSKKASYSFLTNNNVEVSLLLLFLPNKFNFIFIFFINFISLYFV